MGSDPSFKQETGHLGLFKWGVGNGEQPSGEKLGLCSPWSHQSSSIYGQGPDGALHQNHMEGLETSQHVLVLRCATARD